MTDRIDRLDDGHVLDDRWVAPLAGPGKAGLTMHAHCARGPKRERSHPSRFVLVGTIGRRTSYSESPSSFQGWIAPATLLQQLWETAQGTATTTPDTTASASSAPDDSAVTTTSAPTDGTYFGAGRQLSVICGESPNPTSNEVSAEQARISYARAGLNAWPWVAFCQGWTITADDPYLGPWDTATANPVLVVGNTGDPATAYASSQRMADELDAAELLTVDGYGHTQLANPSTCAQAHIARYLIELTLPPPEARCAQDVQPFS